jgi:hypothetical protein
MRAPDFPETTVAAPQTLILRASVNAVGAEASAFIDAAKVGNATNLGIGAAARKDTGGVGAASSSGSVKHDIAHRRSAN